MCDRCELDLLLYGEAVRCKTPVWEKGRFQAQAAEPDDRSPADEKKGREETRRDEE